MAKVGDVIKRIASLCLYEMKWGRSGDGVL